jgi:hypothetical protein
VCVIGGKFTVGIEVKAQKGRLNENQIGSKADPENAGGGYLVVREIAAIQAAAL